MSATATEVRNSRAGKNRQNIPEKLSDVPEYVPVCEQAPEQTPEQAPEQTPGELKTPCEIHAERCGIEPAMLLMLSLVCSTVENLEKTSKEYQDKKKKELDSLFETVKHSSHAMFCLLSSSIASYRKAQGQEKSTAVYTLLQYCIECAGAVEEGHQVFHPGTYATRKDFEDFWKAYRKDDTLKLLEGMVKALTKLHKEGATIKRGIKGKITIIDNRAKVAKCVNEMNNVFLAHYPA